MQHRTLIALPVALGALALGACGSDSSSDRAAKSGSGYHDDDMNMAAGAKAVVDPRSRVKFETPRSGSVEGHRFTARVHLSHFVISPTMVGKSPVPGHGHLHFILDGGKYDYPRYSGPNGAVAKKLGVAGKYSPSLDPKITYERIPRGHHTLVVELANNNHTSTGIEAISRITVK